LAKVSSFGKKKFEKGESSINGDKLKIFAFEKSVWD